MSDLIRRGDVEEALQGLHVGDVRFFEKLRKALDEIPSAEPERKKGEWIEYPDCLGYEDAYSDDHIVCSECEHVFSICNNCTEEFDFCPHCGADMRGE